LSGLGSLRNRIGKQTAQKRCGQQGNSKPSLMQRTIEEHRGMGRFKEKRLIDYLYYGQIL
jgi:hypothetical protein